MNVLYLIHHAGQGGTERYVLSLASKLLESGRGTPFFAYSEAGLLSARMEELGISSRVIEMRNRFDLSAARRVARLCSELKIDVIHTHFLREHYIALLSRLFFRNPRVIYTNHLILANNRLTRLTNRFLPRRRHAVIAGCGACAEQLRLNGFPMKLVTVIHNGINPDEWAGVDGGELRREFCVGDDTEVLLYSARFVEGKGHEFLLNSIVRLAEMTHHPFRLFLAGAGPLLEGTRALADRLGISELVSFLGFREDMRKVLGAADICVNASESETICMSILEGMAAGLPVVATLVGGTGDIVTDDVGMTTAYGDPEGMAHALLRMLEDEPLRKRCSDGAALAVRRRFHLNDMAAKTFDVYSTGLHSK